MCLALWRPQPPGAASSMLFISNETFYKKKKSLRGPHQLHADIVFPLTNSGVFAASVIDRLILEPAGCVSYSPAAFLLPFGQRELKEGGGGGMMGGGGHSAFLLLLPPHRELLIYAPGEPPQLSNHQIRAGSEVMTSGTGGDSPSPFASALRVRGRFFSGICGRGQRDVHSKHHIETQQEKTLPFATGRAQIC